MIPGPSGKEKDEDKAIVRRRDDSLRRALSAPPKPKQKPVKAKEHKPKEKPATSAGH
jgi:hypothetical protein